MTTLTLDQKSRLEAKASALGLSPDIMAIAFELIRQNRHLVNAIDNRTEMDEYIYRAVLAQGFDQRRKEAERDLSGPDETGRTKARRDLTVLSREELVTDPFFRAVLPLIVKVLGGGPVLRLHAEEASSTVRELADFKRKYRATSLTEVIVKNCIGEMEGALAG